MLEKLKIVNFQKHEKLTIDLDQHLTVLVGPSDAGKSAVIRALRWLVLNRPSGDRFIHWGAELAKVELTVDGRTITRKKSASYNAYLLDGKEFKALGQSTVPEEIAAVLRMDDTNFQRQHDSPYWFLDSAGKVSQELNRIINLDIIDESLGNAAAALRSAKADVSTAEQRLTAAQQKQNDLAWTQELDADIAALEQTEEYYNVKRENCARMRREIEGGENAKQSAADAVEAKSDLLPLLTLADQIREATAKAFALRSLVADAEKAAKSKAPPPNTLAPIVQAHGAVLSKLVALKSRISEYIIAEEESCQSVQKQCELQAEMTKQTGGICPVCGGKLRQT
jgi:DNA repair protein SbcC/Rad50